MSSQSHTYTQGHSASTIATHLRRTAESDAAFLLPHIKKTDYILDVGCGPGTITTGFINCGERVVGIDISTSVLQKAKELASEAKIPTEGPGSVVFEEGNILKKLAFKDATFDVVYCSQLFGHLPPAEALVALAEIRRVLKPGGLLATRDGIEQHFYPKSLDLDRLWVKNQSKVLGKGALDPTWTSMPGLFRKAGFGTDDGKVVIGTSAPVISGPEARKWLAARGTGQMKPGDPFRQSWLDAGISEEEIQEMLGAVEKWADTEDAWFVAVQCEMLAWN